MRITNNAALWPSASEHPKCLAADWRVLGAERWKLNVSPQNGHSHLISFRLGLCAQSARQWTVVQFACILNEQWLRVAAVQGIQKRSPDILAIEEFYGDSFGSKHQTNWRQ